MINSIDSTTSISSEDIRNDLVTVAISGVSYEGTFEHWVLFKEFLSSNSTLENPVSEDPDHYGWIFNRSGSSSRSRQFMTVRGSRRRSNKPIALFGGELEFFGSNDENAEVFRKNLRFTLKLNFTRLFAHQDLQQDDEQLSFDRPFRVRNEGSVRKNQLRYRQRNLQIPLDGGDNVILNRPWIEFCTRDNWIDFLHPALSAVVESYLSELNRASRQASVTSMVGNNPMPIISTRRMNFSIWEVESYSEFSVPEGLDSIDCIQNLRQVITTASNSITREYPVNPRYSEDKLSPCITLNVEDNKTLKVYGKTDRRIRIEVCHTRRGLSGNLGELLNYTEVVEGVISQTSDAVIHINRLLDWISRFSNRSETNQNSSLALVRLIYKYSDSTRIASLILGALVSNRTITVSGIPRLRPSIRRLRNHGVLEQTPFSSGSRNVTYCVSSQFTDALEVLVNE